MGESIGGKYGEGINVMLNATQSTGFKKARKNPSLINFIAIFLNYIFLFLLKCRKY